MILTKSEKNQFSQFTCLKKIWGTKLPPPNKIGLNETIEGFITLDWSVVTCFGEWIFVEVPQRIVKSKIIWMLEKILLCYRVSKIKETRLVRSFLQKPLGINLMGVSETCSVWIFKMSRILKICFIQPEIWRLSCSLLKH